MKDKYINVGGCGSTRSGCCADGTSYANSLNDPCKKKYMSNTIIMLISSIILITLGFCIGILIRR